MSHEPAPASEGKPRADVSAPDANDEHDWFADRADAAGLRFVHFNGMSGQFYFPEIMPPGVGLFDYDNDGDLDVFLVQGNMIGPGKTLSDALIKPVEPLPLRSRLYRNDLQVAADGTRTLRFTDVTEQSGIDARGYGMGVATGDIDNDGWVDLFSRISGPTGCTATTAMGPSPTCRRRVASTLPDGASPPRSLTTIATAGWTSTWQLRALGVTNDRTCTVLSDRRSYCGPEHTTGRQTVCITTVGMARSSTSPRRRSSPRAVRARPGCLNCRFRQRRLAGHLLGNDGQANLLWINQRNGTFRTEGLLSGAAVNEQGRPEANMGVDAGDFDNDGDEDLIVTHLPNEGHNLYLNNGSGLFEDRSAPSRLTAAWGNTGWGTAWIDFDNDGWLDMLSVNGALHFKPGRPDDPFPFDERNLLLRNPGNGQFDDVTDKAGAAFKRLEVGRGAAFGDIDNDGDTDVLIANLNGPVRLLVNNIGNRSHWMGLRLVGSGGRDMLGARVEVRQREGRLSGAACAVMGATRRQTIPVCSSGSATTRPRPPYVSDGRTAGRKSGPMYIDRWTTLKEGTGKRR